jgi:DNA-binding winged helix-turn-helix (wHTH) protein
MSRLRRRLGLNPENGFRIKTIYQRGYRLESMQHQQVDHNSDMSSSDVNNSEISETDRAANE